MNTESPEVVETDHTVSAPDDTPKENHDASVLENSNIQADADNSNTVSWKGDARYFQTGKKAGTLKPAKSKEFSGLKLDALKTTETENDAPALEPDKKAIKAQKKLVEAKVASKFVMRILDTLTSWISGGTYGADFTDQQRKARNVYRDELEQDWQDYLVTLDIPMHPAIVAIFGSMLYVAPAFETTKGASRAQTFKEKILGKIVGSLFSRGKK